LDRHENRRTLGIDVRPFQTRTDGAGGPNRSERCGLVEAAARSRADVRHCVARTIERGAPSVSLCGLCSCRCGAPVAGGGGWWGGGPPPPRPPLCPACPSASFMTVCPQGVRH